MLRGITISGALQCKVKFLFEELKKRLKEVPTDRLEWTDGVVVIEGHVSAYSANPVIVVNVYTDGNNKFHHFDLTRFVVNKICKDSVKMHGTVVQVNEIVVPITVTTLFLQS
jgi:hypothetical protein